MRLLRRYMPGDAMRKKIGVGERERRGGGGHDITIEQYRNAQLAGAGDGSGDGGVFPTAEAAQ